MVWGVAIRVLGVVEALGVLTASINRYQVLLLGAWLLNNPLM